MDKLVDYFEKMYKLNKIGHAFLIGNCEYNECLNQLNEVISKYIFEKEINIENNPNIYVISPVNGLITKQMIKDLIRNLNTTSQIEEKKVYIIFSAEKMSTIVNNSLLKTIEEPSDNIYGFLVSSNIEKIIPTIRSRCQTIFVSSNAKDYDEENKIYEIAISLVNTIEKKDCCFLDFKYYYKIIESREIFFEIIKSINNIYINKINQLIGLEYEVNDKINFNSSSSVEIIIKRLKAIETILNSSIINSNKDLLIDKFIIEMLRC